MPRLQNQDIWHLVQFSEDNILNVCPRSRIKINSAGKYFAKWPPDGKWYPAVLLDTGDKESMIAARIQNESIPIKPQPKLQSIENSPDCTVPDGILKRNWRRMCNVPIDDVPNKILKCSCCYGNSTVTSHSMPTCSGIAIESTSSRNKTEPPGPICNEIATEPSSSANKTEPSGSICIKIPTESTGSPNKTEPSGPICNEIATESTNSPNETGLSSLICNAIATESTSSPNKTEPSFPICNEIGNESTSSLNETELSGPICNEIATESTSSAKNTELSGSICSKISTESASSPNKTEPSGPICNEIATESTNSPNDTGLSSFICNKIATESTSSPNKTEPSFPICNEIATESTNSANETGISSLICNEIATKSTSSPNKPESSGPIGNEIATEPTSSAYETKLSGSICIKIPAESSSFPNKTGPSDPVCNEIATESTNSPDETGLSSLICNEIVTESTSSPDKTKLFGPIYNKIGTDSASSPNETELSGSIYNTNIIDFNPIFGEMETPELNTNNRNQNSTKVTTELTKCSPIPFYLNLDCSYLGLDSSKLHLSNLEATEKLLNRTDLPKRRTCTKNVTYRDIEYSNRTDQENLYEEESPEYVPPLSDRDEFSSDTEPSHSDLEIDNILKVLTPLENTKAHEPLRIASAASAINNVEPDLLHSTENDDDNVVEMAALPVAVVDRSSAKRKWDKSFYCEFCKKFYSKLPRHLYNFHSEEPEVAKILSLNKKSKERKKLIEALQNRAAFIRNKITIKEGEGIIMPKRRTVPENIKDVRDYLPCQYCFQMFRKSYLCRHVKICNFKQSADEESKTVRNRGLRSTSYLMLPVGPNVSARFKECILSKMNDDEVFQIIRRDSLILLYGEAEFRRLGHETRYHRTITDRCRELGRLVLAAMELDSNTRKLSQLITPSKYKIFRDAVLKVAGHNAVSNSFKSPSLALKIGFSIKKCISTLKGEYLEDNILRSEIPNLDAFLAILNSKWSLEVTGHAYRTLTERKWNAPKRIPLTKDIQILHKHLLTESNTFALQLHNAPDADAFKGLTKVTLVMIIILNRRRVGEVQYMLLEDYVKAKGCDTESDIYNTLSETERELSKALVRLVIKGKRGRGVPVLLTKTLQDNINLLNSCRHDCGVDPTNKYLFPSLSNSCGYYRAYTLLTKFAKSAGCESVETISSTRLRKHVAVTVQLLNLKENELDSLAQFMGHDIRVHRQFYRLADETVQLAKISKILLNMEKGNISDMRGKSLDEIGVDDNLNENSEEEDNNLVDEGVTDDILQEDGSVPSSSQYPTTQKTRRKTTKESKAKKAKPRGAKRTVIVKKPWSPEAAKVTIEKFQNHLALKSLPGKAEIEKFLEEQKDLLASRSWRNVKDFLYGKLKKIVKR